MHKDNFSAVSLCSMAWNGHWVSTDIFHSIFWKRAGGMFWKQRGSGSLEKLNLNLPFSLSARYLIFWHVKISFLTERDTCTPMFIAALFIIARTWKQPRCPSADEWIKKLWYIYTMEYYSAIKKNTFESVLMRWMKLEPIIQSEVSQKDKDHYSILTHIYGI